MLVGYARVSTSDQNLDLQKQALSSVKCGRVFEDIASGVKGDRPGLAQALDWVRRGDVLVVWKLDRLGRSLQHLIQVINQLDHKGVEFRSLQEQFDTSSPGGRLTFQLFGAIAEFERELIRERTAAGIASARARGRLGGRPKKLTREQIDMGTVLAKDTTLSIKEICDLIGCSRSLYYTHIYGKVERCN